MFRPRTSWLLLAVWLLASSFATTPATWLQRKWRQTPASAKRVVEFIIASVPEENREGLRRQQAEQEAQLRNESMAFAQGKVTIVDREGTSVGTYTLSRDAKTLTVIVNEQEITYQVKQLSATQLVLHESHMGLDLTYEPAP